MSRGGSAKCFVLGGKANFILSICVLLCLPASLVCAGVQWTDSTYSRTSTAMSGKSDLLELGNQCQKSGLRIFIGPVQSCWDLLSLNTITDTSSHHRFSVPD